MPNISVITPVKAKTPEHAKWLAYAIKSVVDQTYDDWEMVIVDDDSPVDLTPIRESIPDRIHWLEGGGGCVTSRNAAAEHATGRFLLPLDADDKLVPGAMEQFLDAWDSGGKDAGYVYSDVMVFGRDFSRLITAPYYDFDKLLQKTYIGVGCLHLKSDWERIGGWQPDMEMGLEDWEYWIALGELGVCGYRVEQPLYYYRRHPAGRLAKLRSGNGDWNIAYAKMRDMHRDTYNGRRKVGCCGKSSRAKVDRTPSEPSKDVSLEDQDTVVMEYTGRRQGGFFVKGRSTGIRYKMSGTNPKFEAHPDDVKFLVSMPRIERAEAQQKAKRPPQPKPEQKPENYDPELLEEHMTVDEIMAELEEWDSAPDDGLTDEERDEIEEGDEPEQLIEEQDVTDPAELNVTYMRSAEFDVTPEQAEIMLEMEKVGKNRVTAIEALERQL